MTDGSMPDLRIGDDERDDALKALGEHLRSGRLDIDEYGDRAARITAARTRGDLMTLFSDLPRPHPGTPAEPAALPAIKGSSAPAKRSKGALKRAADAAVPLSALIAIALFFTVQGMSWVIFLLPAAVGIVVGTLSGKNSDRPRPDPDKTD